MSTTVTIGENTGDDYSGCENNYIDSANPTTNYDGGDTWAIVSSYTVRLLLSFSGLSNISSAATVSAASIYMRNHFAYGGPHTINVYRLLRNWVESEVTWNIYSTGNSWGTAGADGSGTDIDSSQSDSVAQANTSGYQSWSASGIVSDVQDFIDGSESNYGWRLKNTTESGEMYYRLSDWYTDAQRPYLSVTYTTGGASYDGILKRWNGSAWVACDLKRYNGSDFVATVFKWYDSGWKEADTS